MLTESNDIVGFWVLFFILFCCFGIGTSVCAHGSSMFNVVLQVMYCNVRSLFERIFRVREFKNPELRASLKKNKMTLFLKFNT
jgi:hypothetical protein